MYYELYVDSLFLVNFVMNLYLLLLVNRSLFRTATRSRLILGAAIGAVLFLLPILGRGALWVKLLLWLLAGSVIMLLVTFRIRNVRTFFRVLEKLLMYSVLMGGTMLLIRRKIPWIGDKSVGIWSVLGMGALLYLLFGYATERREKQHGLCRVKLVCGGNKVTVTALMDSGNSLVEPISGKPVSVIEKDMLSYLWKEEPYLYRAIPYHSIGKQRGILKGYLVPEIQIETDGVTKICKDIYVAVCEEYITSDGEDGESQVKMIVNPGLLEERNSEDWKIQKRRRMSKERYGYKYDIESGSSG